MMTDYVRICRKVNDYGFLVPSSEVDKYVSFDKELYTSLYYYNQDQFNKFKETKTVRGVSDVFTDKVWFDFDDEESPKNSQESALVVLNRLQNDGINVNDIEIYFSGNKGFHLILNVNKRLTPKEVAAIALKYSGDLKGFDASMYDYTQILRVPGTLHPTTSLHKVPLTYEQISTLGIEEIKHIATSIDNVNQSFNWNVITPPAKFYEVPKAEKKEASKELISTVVDYTNKPSYWKDYKWALLQGHFESGERHNALLIIAATCRALGYDKQTTYYMCKSALKKQAERSGSNEFPKEELWNDIIKSVYSEHWQGGAFSPKNNIWLQKYCEKMGINFEEDKELITSVEDAFNTFQDYAENIDKLTIKTGIPALDSRLRMTVGMSVGIVAPPGVGKTSMTIQMLNNMSKDGHQCVFFSYDMYSAIVFQKLAQRHLQISPDELFHKFKNKDKAFVERTRDMLKEEYKNVHFCFKTGQSIPDIIDTLKQAEDRSGSKIKFVVMDYNELILTDYSDPTVSSAYVAQKMREIAQDRQTCVMSLFQPSKMSGTPADEIKSYRSAKGSSAIEQSVSVMLGMSRPGFNPRSPDADIFTNINCLKNRMGPLFSLDFRWDGLTGTIREMSEEERILLKQLRESKEESEKEGWN